MIRPATLAIALVLAVPAAVAQPPSGPEPKSAPVRPVSHVPEPARMLTQYALDHWDDRDGLPQNSVQALAQTTDGYLWLGTQAGVVRFDGVRFTTYGRDASPALRRPYIWALAPDPDGSLWIGTEEGGLLHMDGGRFTALTTEHGLPSNMVNAIHRDRQGTLWVGTGGGGLARIRDGRIEAIDTTASNPGGWVFEIYEDDQGIVWVGSNHGLTRIEGDRFHTIGMEQGLPGMRVLSIAPAREGGLWLGTGGAVARYRDGGVAATYSEGQGLPKAPVRSLREDRDGALWIAGPAGLFRLAGGQVTPVPARQLPHGSIEMLFPDREGNLWVGTAGFGLYRLREAPVVPLGVPEGLPSDAVFPVLQDRDGALWVGTGDAGLARMQGGKTEVYDVTNRRLPANLVFSLAQDREGAVWVGTQAGVTRIHGSTSTHYGAEEGMPAHTLVRAILPDRSGGMWLGTPQGLYRFRPGRPAAFARQAGLADEFVGTLMEDRDGAVWVGTRTGVSRLHGGRVTTWTQRHGLPDAAVTALHRGADGTLWIGTGAGLARMRDGRIATFTTAQGLCDQEIHWLLEDARGRLWLSGNLGIFTLSPREVEAVASGRQARLTCALFGRAEGMRSRETNGAVNPAGARLVDGSLVFPTMGGLATFRPDELLAPLPPPQVKIEEVVADGRMAQAVPQAFPPGTRELEVHFTAPSFNSSDAIRFRYRLRGLDDAWTETGTRRVAYFTHLPPGDYVFEVQARHAYGDWGPAAATLAFELRPHFWQTWWFRTLAALGVLALAALAYRTRVRSLHRRERALLRLVDERSRAEARYRELFDNATDAVFTTDLKGRFTALNRRAEELTGYTRDEAAGMNLRVLLPPGEEGDRVAREWRAGTAGGTVDIVAKNGTRIPLELLTRVVEEDGRAVGTQAVGRDVRERAALERQLRESQKMEAVGQLAGGVAHDFNNLLTIIQGSGQMVLSEMEEDDGRREDIGMILGAAERAAGLTRQLLAFSRRQVTQPRVVDLNALIAELEPMLRRLIGEDIRVTSSTCAQPTLVVADPGQLEQVLVNLAVNARDAMPGGGTLTIRTTILEEAELPGDGGPGVLLSLTDTGVGMDAATQARIFEPFFTTKPSGKGTGLGLSTVYGIVRQAGGSVHCVSRPGRGTTFQIRLPYAGDLAEAAAPAAAAGSPLTGSETILLVEDEIAVRAMASRILRRYGYTVLETHDGADALRAAAGHGERIDLLLTDVVMPEMSGRELAERLTAERPELRVLYMSGYTDDEIIRRGLFQAGVRYLQKPFSVEGLARAVRDLLDLEDAGRDAWRDQPEVASSVG